MLSAAEVPSPACSACHLPPCVQAGRLQSLCVSSLSRPDDMRRVYRPRHLPAGVVAALSQLSRLTHLNLHGLELPLPADLTALTGLERLTLHDWRDQPAMPAPPTRAMFPALQLYYGRRDQDHPSNVS